METAELGRGVGGGGLIRDEVLNIVGEEVASNDSP